MSRPVQPPPAPRGWFVIERKGTEIVRTGPVDQLTAQALADEARARGTLIRVSLRPSLT